jgi:hypothetical protein
MYDKWGFLLLAINCYLESKTTLLWLIIIWCLHYNLKHNLTFICLLSVFFLLR